MKILLSVFLLQATSAFASTLIVLAKEAPNAVAWALSPLPEALPPEIRQNILLLREDLVDEGKTQPKTSLDAYRSGYQVCNSLIAALDERDAAKTNAGMSQTQVTANGTARNEARRNYMMSWPQYQADAASAERAKESLQNAKDTLLARQNAAWLKRAADLRGGFEKTYAAYRDALRKDPAFVQAMATANTISSPANSSANPKVLPASELPGKAASVTGKQVAASSLKALKAGEILGVTLAAGSQVPFIWCPPGDFIMGSPKTEVGRKDGVEDQVPVKHSKGFWISAYEWQQRDWQAIEGNNPSEAKGETMPVTNVGWNDAVEHCAKLNAFGLLPSGYKFALPTEAQWEYACRAGEGSALYNGKELSGITTCTNLDPIAWYRLNSGEKLHPVGGKKPNKWGAFDMLGNVWEWCLDSYADKLLGGSDPVNLEDGANKVSRGGAWWAHSVRSRSADRGGSAADYRFKAVGFRVCIVQE
jgi:formylglycine-generating enzyme required for sulfatase activity